MRSIIDSVATTQLLLLAMSKGDLDQLRLAYKQAVDAWVAAIRDEETLAPPDHSMTAFEKWDDAHFREQDAQSAAKKARDDYKHGLRAINYSI